MRKNPISKTEAEKIEYLIDDIHSGKLIINHPLQRYSKQWGAEQKGNLIRRALHGGQFLPILICTQYDDYGCEVKYLIDGIQRMTAFEEFLNDGFAISKNIIDYEVDYDGIVYETKNTSSGKFVLKRDRNKRLIPVPDKNGKIQKRVQTIDIRGLRYSELPPELQEKIKRYLVTVQLKLECTDEDIRLEILDYNNGTKMNDAQIGKNRLGVGFAKKVIDLSKHSFIKNKCGFTEDNRIKGVIDRAINESLMLVNFGTENWVPSHKDLCRRLSNRLTSVHTDMLKNMFNELDEIIPEDVQIKSYLTLKEFFVVMANYKHFRDSGYKKKCYAVFLNDFIKELSYKKIIPAGKTDDNGAEIYDAFRNVYMYGSKQKASVERRLNEMNNMLDRYLKENCAGMKENNNRETTDGFSLENAPEELQEFAQGFASDELAIETLMLLTDCPDSNFSKEKLDAVVERYKISGEKSILNDCLFYKNIAIDDGIDENDADLPLYAYAVKYIDENNIDIDADRWLEKFRKTAFAGIGVSTDNLPCLNNTITQKKSEIIKSIQKYKEEAAKKGKLIC